MEGAQTAPVRRSKIGANAIRSSVGLKTPNARLRMRSTEALKRQKAMWSSSWGRMLRSAVIGCCAITNCCLPIRSRDVSAEWWNRSTDPRFRSALGRR